MANQTNESFDAVQIKHWVTAVKNGHSPTIADKKEKTVKKLPLPLARSDGNRLTFTLSKTGTATWVLRYRYGGRGRELTIGGYPDIGLSEARKLAREYRVKIDQGGDPASEKKQAKTQALLDWRVRQLIEDYSEKILSDLSASSQRSYGRSLKRMESKIGSLTVTQVTPLDIVSMLESAHVTWSESSMLLCAAKMVFRHAAAKRIITVNPTAGIELKALLGKRPPIRRRLMLSEEELVQLLHAKMKKKNALAIRILLATAVRSEELIKATWDQIDLTQRVWSVPSTKTGAGIQIPLTDQTAHWFSELKSISGGSDYVLPTKVISRKERTGGDAPVNRNTIGQCINYWLDQYKPPIRPFTPHDLRSTAKSHMRALGIPRDITEMCLNHKLPGVEGIYDVHTYFTERKQALEIWNGYLKKLEDRT